MSCATRFSLTGGHAPEAPRAPEGFHTSGDSPRESSALRHQAADFQALVETPGAYARR